MDTTQPTNDSLGDLVISHAEGANLGSVQNVFIDPKMKRVSGITFRRNVFSDAHWVASSAIELFGEDVIVIKSKGDTTAVEDGITNGTAVADLKGHPVVTDSGKRLGTLEDVELSGAERTISELFLNQHRHLTVQPEEIEVGPDEIVVPSTYEKRVADDDNHTGFMERMNERRAAFVSSVKGTFQRDGGDKGA